MMLKTMLLATAVVGLAGSAYAAIPTLNATCPTGIEVHADEGGPIYINGKEAKLTTYNKNAYDAKHGHITISLTINPDGTASVMYTKDGGANGICTIAGSGIGGGDDAGGCPVDVSEADRYKYPACN